jgi:hypothetical protein
VMGMGGIGNRELQAEVEYLTRVTEIYGVMLRVLGSGAGEGLDGERRVKFDECVAELHGLREVRPVWMSDGGL